MGRTRKWVSWNVRGLGSAEKRRAVKDSIRSSKCEVILLQKTKLGNNKARFGELFANSLNHCFVEVLAIGSAGGLISCWDPRSISVTNVIKDQWFILLVAQTTFLSYPVIISNFYGPNSESQRRSVLNNLAIEIGNLAIGCFLGGDFNDTLNFGERRCMEDVVDSNLCDVVLGLNLMTFHWRMLSSPCLAPGKVDSGFVLTVG